mmetsp:Transcript_39285/g.45689  ORF Transcript_39285/g.45689 Transcript_39285/m.45689 type:complete len:233 (+) Transcript_39285:70-768(+)|eukprot:CAMPEP_0176430358 /NCGR_PEP_ID=MMETSP0127-20121128/14204_1 /TAXON_ID=938130 /ORGANISM="Platyophrya macrostoma, Strain WH" /LENGTH=232 /DNA_ID=CAMNT_0017812229 /DNA_START=142 /DNA_END=840 /DNA_ORIENTATION=+
MKKILVVITSSTGPMGNGHETGLWLEELAAPFYVFREAGFEVVLASPKGGKPPLDSNSLQDAMMTAEAKKFLDDEVAMKAFSNTIPLAEITADGFAGIFYPGGHGPIYDLHSSAQSIALIEAFASSGRPVGSVCHGPVVLLNAKNSAGAPLVAGKRVTGFSNAEEAAVGLTDAVPFLLENELKGKGALYEVTSAGIFTPFVVCDFPLFTGQNPPSSTAVAEAFVKEGLLKSS